MANPLITLTRLKSSLTSVADPAAPSPDDTRYQEAIDSASALVRSFTGLVFEVQDPAAPATPRLFEYDGCGYLTIDEATTITGVSSAAGYSGAVSTPYTVDQWGAYPLNLPVKLWLRLPSGGGYLGASPAMGFTWNLDQLYMNFPPKPNIITVTAKWGWPVIPEDVQQATVWTAMGIADTPRVYQQESIEGYSHSTSPSVTQESIPERAQAALLPYLVPNV